MNHIKMRRCCGFIGVDYQQEAHEAPESEFQRSATRRTGFVSRCTPCKRAANREYSQAYQKANRAQIAAKSRKWRASQRSV